MTKGKIARVVRINRSKKKFNAFLHIKIVQLDLNKLFVTSNLAFLRKLQRELQE